MIAIETMLDDLAELRARLDLLNIEKETLRDNILAPVKQQLADLNTEFAPALENLNSSMATVEAQIKQAVLERGASVKGERLQAVYSKPRESVDMKAFSGYCVAHPDARQLLQVGAPSVSIRVNGKA
jgi:uncharacterized protein involved in exopolysaccharide biosynthesis